MSRKKDTSNLSVKNKAIIDKTHDILMYGIKFSQSLDYLYDCIKNDTTLSENRKIFEHLKVDRVKRNIEQVTSMACRYALNKFYIPKLMDIKLVKLPLPTLPPPYLLDLTKAYNTQPQQQHIYTCYVCGVKIKRMNKHLKTKMHIKNVNKRGY